jgi:UTP:GlnB (protein PII) uridylyltransferase
MPTSPTDRAVSERQSGKPLLEQLSNQLVPELKRYLAQHRASVEAVIQGGGLEVGYAAGQRFAKIYDGLLSALFHAARTAMLRDGNWHPVSLAAVGSYGRGSLCPHSDLDVRLLCDRQRAGVLHPAAGDR